MFLSCNKHVIIGLVLLKCCRTSRGKVKIDVKPFIQAAGKNKGLACTLLKCMWNLVRLLLVNFSAVTRLYQRKSVQQLVSRGKGPKWGREKVCERLNYFKQSFADDLIRLVSFSYMRKKHVIYHSRNKKFRDSFYNVSNNSVDNGICLWNIFPDVC